MFRTSWAIALGFSIAMIVGILIVTRDLSVTSDIFKDGVAQARTVDATTDQALVGAAQLPPANAAIHQGMPQVVGVIDSLSRADATLGSLGDQLQALSTALQAADPPLHGIVTAGQSATEQANAAAAPAESVAASLVDIDAKTRDLVPVLDQTLALSQTIDAKLRISLLLPVLGN
ncbi:hypothetical protein EEB14_08475 [Rhodococcus sp. WS4]|nr:hypothetical protein EEB14_08475 [Rhodococcus sp. WS4]